MEEMEEVMEMEEMEMVALALEDDKSCCWAYGEHFLSDYLEVESQSATNVTLPPLGVRLFEYTFENA